MWWYLQLLLAMGAAGVVGGVVYSVYLVCADWRDDD